MEGWIKLNRSIKNWEWYDDPNTMRLWIHLLLSANYESKKWRGIQVESGQIITSINHLSEDLNLSQQQTRTALDKLKSTNEITIKTTNKYTVVTIEKWAIYQTNDECDNKQNNKQNNNQITNKQQAKQQTNNKQITTTKEIKKDKNIRKKENPFISNNNNNALREAHEAFMRMGGVKAIE